MKFNINTTYNDMNITSLSSLFILILINVALVESLFHFRVDGVRRKIE